MPQNEISEKKLTIAIPEDWMYELKGLALSKRLKMKEACREMVKDYLEKNNIQVDDPYNENTNDRVKK